MAKKKKNPILSLFIFLLVCIIAVVCVKISYDVIMTYLYPKKYSEYVSEYAAEYSIDEIFLYSVIKTESGFDPDAVSSAGARGLTQITEDTFNWLHSKTGDECTFDDLFSPDISVKYGAYFLSILMDEYGDTATACAAYHAGMGQVSSWLSDSGYSDDGVHLKEIPISDTAYYVEKVQSAMDKYKKIYDN